MANFCWRIPARVVAVLELILVCVLLFLMVILAIIACIAYFNMSEEMENLEMFRFLDYRGYTGFKNLYLFLWIVASVLAVYLGANLSLIITLIEATAEGAEPVKARKQANIWVAVRIAELLVATALLILIKAYILLGVGGLVSIVFILIVWRYAVELKLSVPEPWGVKV